MPRLLRAAVLAGAGAAAALLLAGCSSTPQPPDFTPSPSGVPVEGNDPVHIDPILPTPSLGTGAPSQGSGVPSSGEPSGNPSGSTQDPFVVATKLSSPVGLTLLPDGTALVGERTTGRIVRVQPRAGQPVPTVRTLTGLDTSGDGGLLDLALSPDYGEDNLIFAYVTTPKDNRVVDFTLDGPVTPVLTGIPRGSSGNSGRIAFGADGDLYIGTGDAGRPSLAADPHSLAGKILRINAIGAPATGNPDPSSPIYASGLAEVTGLCPDPSDDTMLETGPDPAGGGAINVVRPGADYGFPHPTSSSTAPVDTVPARYGTPGDCAVLGGRLWVPSLDGRTLLQASVRTGGGTAVVGSFGSVLNATYGRLRTSVPASDGALWLTTSNRDGHGSPVPADERVIRYPPQVSGGDGGKVT